MDGTEQNTRTPVGNRQCVMGVVLCVVCMYGRAQATSVYIKQPALSLANIQNVPYDQYEVSPAVGNTRGPLTCRQHLVQRSTQLCTPRAVQCAAAAHWQCVHCVYSCCLGMRMSHELVSSGRGCLGSTVSLLLTVQ